MAVARRAEQLKRLLNDFGAGANAALARVVTIVENQAPGFEFLLSSLYARTGKTRRIGVTGPPGAGKSSITAQLVAHYRAGGLRVGVVAVDPTSPYTGGALLGDRIRMEAVALDPGVFIRSMATRGSLGGLAASTRQVADVLDAFGLDRVVIETVGVGQTELNIAGIADTSVVVLVPESGDSIQAMKAGLMEIADLFVVNKADRPGADRLRHELELMIGLRSGAALRHAPAHHGPDLGRSLTREERLAMNPARAAREAASGSRPDAGNWTVPVLSTMALDGSGVPELAATIDRHLAYLEQTGELRQRRRKRIREQVVDIVERKIQQRLWGDPAITSWLDGELPDLEAGRTNPFAVADDLLSRSSETFSRTGV